MTAHQPLIFCALDTPDLTQAKAWARVIGKQAGIKLGLEFFNAFGPQGVREVMKEAPEAALFLDLKYHDIPNTVAGAVRAACGALKPQYLNVHASGGLEMMKAAKDSCAPGTKLLAVTVLTSMDDAGLNDTGVGGTAAAQVKRLALLAREAGLDGVVCSAHEIADLRASFGPDFILMVPGIRPVGVAAGDQKRIMTPREAVTAGASHLVIGRPITQAADPQAAIADILQDIHDSR